MFDNDYREVVLAFGFADPGDLLGSIASHCLTCRTVDQRIQSFPPSIGMLAGAFLQAAVPLARD